MKISITLDVSESRGSRTVDLEDLGLTKEQWESMDEQTQTDHLQEWVNELPEHPYWCVDKFTTKES